MVGGEGGDPIIAQIEACRRKYDWQFEALAVKRRAIERAKQFYLLCKEYGVPAPVRISPCANGSVGLDWDKNLWVTLSSKKDYEASYEWTTLNRQIAQDEKAFEAWCKLEAKNDRGGRGTVAEVALIVSTLWLKEAQNHGRR